MDNFSAIGFYPTIDKQLRNLEYNKPGTKYQNLCPADKIIPHSFSIPTGGLSLTSALLQSTDGTDIKNITSQYTAINKTDYTIFYNPGTTSIAGLTKREYYIAYSISGQTYYSDTFVFCPEGVDEFLKLEFFHLPDTGLFPYQYDDTTPETIVGAYDYNGMGSHTIYFNKAVALGKPTYPYEENVDTRISRKFPITQISYKLWRFKALLPEYLLDVLRLARLHSNVVITYLGNQLTATEFLMGEPSWIDVGVLAEIEFEFRTSAIAVQHAKIY